MEIKTYLDIVKDVVTILAAVTGGVVAVLGLKTWRRQLKGNVEYDLARRVLKSSLKLRDTISEIRRPWMGLREIRSALKELDKTNEEEQGHGAQSAVYQVRWKKISNAVADLEIELLEAETLWGKEIRQVLKPLFQCVSVLSVNVTKFLNLDLYQDKEKIDAIIYETGTSEQPDNFSKEINGAIEKAEVYLKKYLKL